MVGVGAVGIVLVVTLGAASQTPSAPSAPNAPSAPSAPSTPSSAAPQAGDGAPAPQKGSAKPKRDGRALDLRAFTFELPKRIVLGRTKTAPITVRAKNVDGTPLDVAPPKLAVSIGSVSAPERLGPGAWSTTYTPPESGAPQIAVLLAAIDAGASDAVGYATLALWGLGETVVQTEPGSMVTLKAGEQTMLPTKADLKGKARVKLELPPGVSKAIASSLDSAGNTTEKSIDLGIPPFNRVAVLALDEATFGDGRGLARLLAVAVDERGQPLNDAKLRVKASPGTGESTSTKIVAPGVTEIVVHPPRTNESKVDVDVELLGSEESKARASVALIAGSLAGATLSLSKIVLSDDETDREIAASVRLVDAAGNTVPAQAAGIHVDLGRISSFSTDEDGTRRLTWIIPRGARRQRATMTVHLADDTVLATAEVRLPAGSSGKTTRLSFDPVRFVVADGNASAELAVRVRDLAPNELPIPEPGVPVVAPPSAAHVRFAVPPEVGTVSEPSVSGVVVRAMFTPAPSTEERVVQVIAKLGDEEASVDVLVVPPGAPGRVGGGLVVASNYEEVVGVGAELGLHGKLPFLATAPLYFGGSLGFVQSIVRPEVVLDQRAVPLLGEASWRPSLSPTLELVLGAAAGPVLSDVVERDPRDGRVPGEHVLDFAIATQLVAGAGFRVGTGVIDVVARLGTAFYLDDDAVAAATVGLPFGGGVVVAYRWDLR